MALQMHQILARDVYEIRNLVRLQRQPPSGKALEKSLKCHVT